MDVDEVFKTEWPKVVATLLRDFGDLDLAEECTQEAFVEATKRWPVGGTPDRPGGWLVTTARRKALDRVRRTATHEHKIDELLADARADSPDELTTLVDDQLALLLGCCHPALNHDAQVALTLRVVAGLATEQIARAYLVDSGTMGRRLSRAKQKIRDANIAFRAPDRTVLAERIDAVRHVIYVIFTEGHVSRSSERLVRGDLCDEAIWLAELLTSLLPDDPESYGLSALILLTDSRRLARVDASGLPVLLEEQDRSLWDRAKISAGMRALSRAVECGPVGPFGLQAIIASLHSGAPSFAATPWSQIVRMYDLLFGLNPSPIVALNRAGAVSYAEGPAVGLAAVDELVDDLGDYLYFHTARADMLRRLHRPTESGEAYQHALTCDPSPSETAFVERQLSRLSP